MASKIGSLILDIRTNTAKFMQGIGRSKKAVGGLKKSIGGLNSALVALGGALAIRQLVNVIVKFESLEASLITVTGSAEAAEKAFNKIKLFAKTTPFQVSEITDAFIKMKALGLDPSEAALRSYGNTASAMGKSLNQIVEAVADAATGEFERLKEFGIKSSSQGDKVTFTFNNVKTTVGKNAKEIETFLQSLGNTKFAGGMTRQMSTLGGSFSNFQDTAEALIVELGEAGLSDVIKSLTESMIALAPAVSAVIKEFRDLQRDAAAAGVQIFNVFNPKVQTAADLIRVKILKTNEAIREQQEIMKRNDLSVYNPAMVNKAGIELQKLTKQLQDQNDVLNSITSKPPITTLGGDGKKKDSLQSSIKRDVIKAGSAVDLEAIKKSSAERLEALQTGYLSETESLAEALVNRQFIIEDAFQNELISSESKNSLLEDLTRKHEDEKTKIADKGAKERNRVLAGQLGAAASIFGSLSSLMNREGKKQSAAQKLLARASIIASTAQAVMNALAVPPYPLGVTLAVAAGLKGAEQLSKVGGGGGGSGTSVGGLTQGAAGVDLGFPGGVTNGAGTSSQTQIIFTGDVFGLDDLSERLVEIIQNATNDRDIVIFNGDSRQAAEIRDTI